jgi:mevalonate kinase
VNAKNSIQQTSGTNAHGMKNFSVTVPAKWVLAGEHSVMRGRSAITFPYLPFSMKLSYEDSSQPFQVNELKVDTDLTSLMKRGFQFLNQSFGNLSGELSLESNIPIGAGLGSSAALCVAMSRFVLWKCESIIPFSQSEWIKLATHLEHVFHGKSSGMDVTAIIHSQGIEYNTTREPASIAIGGASPHGPKFTLNDTGKRGQTRDCIQIVKAWQENHPELISKVDDQMHEASLAARQALESYPAAGAAFSKASHAESDQKLALAMQQAQNCFETWGLVPADLMEQKRDLMKQGALAVKLTGAGLGGFWVALWPSEC